MSKNKEFVNNKPLTKCYMKNGTLVKVYGELNVKQFALAIHNYMIKYNIK